MEHLEIIEAAPSQLYELAELAKTVWHEHFTPIIGEEQVEYMLEKFQSPTTISEQLKQGYHYYFFCFDGKNAGYTGIKKDGNSLFLSKIYIEKEYRGKKIARAAINFMTDICKKQNLKEIWLTVNRHNDIAIAAYKAMGFKILRAQVKDIGGGFAMDDYIMSRQIEL